MKVFFRAQGKGITFEEMKNHVSADGGDGLEGAGGVCACLTVTDLLNNTVMDAAVRDVARAASGMFYLLPERDCAEVFTP